MSNSPIVKFKVVGSTGPQGRIGATGNSGGRGNTGNTGNTGAYGRYYSSFLLDGGRIFLTYSDGTTAELSGDFRGSTYADKTSGLVKGSNTGGYSGYGLLYNVNGGTFFMKGICAYGSLRASLTGANNEYISIDTIYWGTDLIGNYDLTTMAPGRFLYLGTPTVIYGAGITHTPITTENTARGISGAFNFEIPENYSSSNHLNAGSRILQLGPIKNGAFVGFTGGESTNGEGTTTGIFLDADSAGTFVLHTPIGIRGISGSFRKNEIDSITVLIDSDDVWTFPQNIYFEPDENYLSCGKNIIGLMTYDGGDTWIATPAHRGHGVENVLRQCIPGYLFGSCCYENLNGTLECKDYSTRSECDRLFGTFSPATPCEYSCGTKIGICCAGNQGNCVEGVSVSTCNKFGGIFWEGVTCSDYNSSGSNYADPIENGRFCYDPCSATKTVCCKNGRCLGNYTRVQCETILGGKSILADNCQSADCCTYETINGACCKCSAAGYVCEQLQPSECATQGGIYMGPGKQCNEVSCGCVCSSDSSNPFGACCGLTSGTCENIICNAPAVGCRLMNYQCVVPAASEVCPNDPGQVSTTYAVGGGGSYPVCVDANGAGVSSPFPNGCSDICGGPCVENWADSGVNVLELAQALADSLTSQFACPSSGGGPNELPPPGFTNILSPLTTPLQRNTTCQDNVTQLYCNSQGGNFILGGNCNSCTSSFNVSTNTQLTDVRLYINSTEWICVSIACGDCIGYELCGAY